MPEHTFFGPEICHFYQKLAPDILFGEISMVSDAKSVNESIASTTAEHGSMEECVSHELKFLKYDPRFTQRHTDLLIISRSLSRKHLIAFYSSSTRKLAHICDKEFGIPLYFLW